MASALMRRSVLTAAMAAIATVASPLATAAFAAGVAPTESSASPSGTSAANRPTISVTFNAPIASESAGSPSTLGLFLGADRSTNLCGPAHVSTATISCTPTADLTDGKSYQYVATAYDAATDSAKSSPYTGNFTTDIPSLVTSNPANGSTVPSAQTISATYDESVDATGHSTASLTSSDGARVPGVVTYKASASGKPSNDTIQFVADQSLPDGSYTATFHVDGVTQPTLPIGSPTDNPNAFANNVIHFVVDHDMPSFGPFNVSSPPYINQANQSAVPFSGYAQPGYSVGVAIYDESTDSSANPKSKEGFGANDGFNSVVVGSCIDADAKTDSNSDRGCPWSLTVNMSSKKDNTLQWYAYSFSNAGQVPAHACSTASAANGCPSADPTITKDTTGPNQPLGGSAAISGNTVTVTNVTDPFDSDLDHYRLVVNDDQGHSATKDNIAPSNTGAMPSTTIDISGLDDGADHVTVYGVDASQNISDPDAVGDVGKSTVTFAQAPKSADSLSTSNATYNFNNLTTGKTIKTPTSVTVYFNEPVTLRQINDTSTPGSTKPLYKSELCLNDVNTGINCLNRRDGSLSLTSDKRGIVWTAPAGYSLPDGTFTVSAFGVSAECPDETATNKSGYFCERSDNPGAELARFNIDNTAPAVHVTGVNGSGANNGINADSIKSTVISGTVDPDASSITLAIKSSGGGATRLIPGPAGSGESITITPPAQGQPLATWSTSGLDLSTLPDGTLTIVASAVDAAGNQQSGASSSDQDAAITTPLQARPTAPQNFRATAGNGQAFLTWTAPASAGATDRAVTSYSLTYTDTSVPGATAVAAASPAGNATTAVVSSLQNGHTYSFSLAATNFDSSKAFQGGSGPTATTTATPKGNTAISLIGPAHGIITDGQSFGLGGNLTYFGVGLANEKVKVTSRYYNGAPGPSSSATTDQNGHWAVFGLKPAKNIVYTATFAGDGAYNGSSRSSGVLVRAAIAITKVTARTKSHTSPVTLSGKVAPNLSGYRVYIYEVRGSKLVKIGSAKLSSKSTWVFVHTFSKGTHLVIAKFFGHAGNATNQTGRVKIVRT